MSKILIFLSLLFLSTGLSGQSIKGKIYSQNTKDALVGVSIRLEGPVSMGGATDEKGIFNFQNIQPGKYTIKASYVGYNTYQTTLILDNEGVNLDIFLISQSGSLPEVQILSASRRNTSSVHLPFASSVLNLPAQSENIPRTVPESLNIIPGVFVQKTNHGGGSPFIRGLTGNQTLILIDGIRLNNSTFRYGPNQYLNTIDPFSVNKIEVLRGSGSVQYGSDAIGGVIQIFTKDPGYTPENSFKGSVSGRFGSSKMEQSGSTELSYSTSKMVLSGILGIKNFGDLIGGDTTGRQSPSGYSQSDASLKFKLKVSNNSELILANQFVQQKDVDVYHKVQLENFNVNKMGLQGRNLSYLKYSIDQESSIFRRIDITGSLNATVEERNSQKNASQSLGLERDKIKTSNLGIELFSDLSKKWTVNSGLEYYRDKVNSIRNTTNLQSGAVSTQRGLYPDNSLYSNTSVYSLHHLALGNFNLEGGLRYNWLQARIADKDLGRMEINPGAFVWNSGLNYSIGKNHIYTSFNTGYRAPNIDDMGTLGIVDFRYEIPAYTLKPEKSYNSEIGYKYFSEHLSFGAALYRNKLSDLINRVQTGQIIDGYKVYMKENTEEAVIKGVEGFAEFQVSQNLFFDLFASFNHGRNISKAEPLRRVPPFNGNISMKYKMNKFYMKAEMGWADKQDRLAQGDKDDNRIPAGGTPGWKVLNIYSGYSLKNVHLRLIAQNLFNADYRTHGSGINSVGRSLWMSLSFDF
ncbi:TonB-dependent receptor [Daejeonella sp.]|uniref:TonB-dependent receptor n=1 Tax=Daejeonella sp. TaxID=2805397 RepID=UPI002C1F0646|nr:TonB-dependent receptor [Daejeonella sp.]HQT24405.1 TonB-dependent receptor [Daejeonella sp.]HQT58994.1 TonB-dependent receptor [Daejeonella sp.]